jgi:hypothetical protein
MCIVPASPTATTTAASPCPATILSPDQRQLLALHALAGSRPIRQLADQRHVSRQFVYRQAGQARQALHQAFDPAPADRQVLFTLPVTKDWLHQLVLGLVLIGHSPLRGVQELLDALFDYPLSVGAIHQIVHAAVPGARRHHDRQDRAGVRIGVHDEICQAGQPALVGGAADSTSCYLLSQEQRRDTETWAVRLLESADRGLRPEATIADAAPAQRAGGQVALPGVVCRGDVFHPFDKNGGHVSTHKLLEER